MRVRNFTRIHLSEVDAGQQECESALMSSASGLANNVHIHLVSDFSPD